jgi:hypothetical protein
MGLGLLSASLLSKLSKYLPKWVSGQTQTTNGSSSQATSSTIYVQSDIQILGDGTFSKTTDDGLRGNDDTGDGSLANPFRSLDGVYRAYNFDAALQGMEYIVRLLSDRRDDPDQQPTAYGRAYLTRQVKFSAGESYRNNVSYRGGRLMRPTGPVATLTGVTNLYDGFYKLTHSTPLGGTTYHLMWYSSVNGYLEVTAPIPVVGTTPDGHSIVPAPYGILAADILANHSSVGLQMQVVVGAAFIGYDSSGLPPTSDAQAGVLYTNRMGPFRAGDRRDTSSYDLSQRPSCERIHHGHSTWDGSFHIHHARFADRARMKGGEIRMSGCVSEGDIYWQAEGRHLGADSQFSLYTEHGCRVLKPANLDTVPPAIGPDQINYGGYWDPLIPQSSNMVELAVSENAQTGGTLWIGEELGGKPCVYRNEVGLAVRHPGAGVGIKVTAGGRYWQNDNAYCAVKVSDPKTHRAILTVDGGRARLPYSGGQFVSNAMKPFQVGLQSAGVTGADFLSASKWNKQLTDRGTAAGDGGGPDNGRYPTGDASMITDATVEPSGSYKNIGFFIPNALSHLDFIPAKILDQDVRWWVRPEDIVGASNLTSWPDASGYGVDATAVSTGPPVSVMLNGFKGVTMTPGLHRMDFPSALWKQATQTADQAKNWWGQTIFALVKVAGTTSGGSLLFSSDWGVGFGGEVMSYDNASGKPGVYWGGFQAVWGSSIRGDGLWHVITWSFNDQASTTSVAVDRGTPVTGGGGGTQFNWRGLGDNSGALAGTVQLVTAFAVQSQVTAADRGKVIDGINAKFGLSL